jgi:hypothetical protein
VRLDAVDLEVGVSIRLFLEDLLQALERQPGSRAGARAEAASYAASRFALYTEGRALRLMPCGVRFGGDVVQVCFRARAPQGLTGLSVSNRLLVELFDDQINIVQVIAGGRRSSLVFTKGDGVKLLVLRNPNGLLGRR